MDAPRLFNPSVTIHGTLADTFRIFTDGEQGYDTAPDTRLEPDPTQPALIAYTDGSATDNGQENARAGCGVYFGVDHPDNIAIRVPSHFTPSNQTAEILAIKECCEVCPLDVELSIKSDSRTMIDGLTTNLSRWEDEGFLTVADG